MAAEIPREEIAAAITRGDAIVCLTKCWPCQFGDHFEPAEWHTWADEDDVRHARDTGQPDPSTSRCGCPCAGPPAPTERKHPAVSTENPISDLVNAALNGGDTPDDGSEHRPELASAYNLLYGTPVLVELVTGEAQRPTMGTAIRIVNALADAGLLNVAGGRSGDR